MAIRTSISEVKQIISTSLVDGDITAMIDFANKWLNVINWKVTLTEAELKDIETWLTAHFISVSKEKATVKEKVGEASVEYVNEFAMNLASTLYGQTALLLDTSGTLSSLSRGKMQASIRAVTSFN